MKGVWNAAHRSALSAASSSETPESAARSATDLVRMTSTSASARSRSRGWDGATLGSFDVKSSDFAGESRISTLASVASLGELSLIHISWPRR